MCIESCPSPDTEKFFLETWRGRKKAYRIFVHKEPYVRVNQAADYEKHRKYFGQQVYPEGMLIAVGYRSVFPLDCFVCTREVTKMCDTRAPRLVWQKRLNLQIQDRFNLLGTRFRYDTVEQQ